MPRWLVTCSAILLPVSATDAQDSRPGPAQWEARKAPETVAGSVAVALVPQLATKGRRIRWSPKGAKVFLKSEAGGLAGSFELGLKGARPLRVRLENSAGAAHYDRLRIDRNRDGSFGADELLSTVPRERRHKFWSSFQTVVSIPVPGDKAAGGHKKSMRSYPLNLWFVVDPREPTTKPVLRWSRSGWHQGEVTISGQKVFVLVTERRLDGVFDRRDSWALAVDQKALFDARGSSSLAVHSWLGERAFRVTKLDPSGLRLEMQPFDPGITRAEEVRRKDRLAPDRNARRAARPLAFRKDFKQAEADARAQGKPLFLDFETTWCGPCKTMTRYVYSAEKVVRAASAAEVIAVKLDGDEARDLVKRFSVQAYPTMILLSPEGKEIRRARGYRGVAAMAEFFAPLKSTRKQLPSIR